MSSALSTRYLSGDDYPEWNRLVRNSSLGSIYSTPEYLEVLCSSTGGRFRILAAERSGSLVGGIALYERETKWGRYSTGRLLLYYNGIVEPTYASSYPSERTSRHNELMFALEAAISSAGYGRVQIRNLPSFTDGRVFQSRKWKVTPSYSYIISLHDLPAQWQRVEQNLRRLIQRCERASMQITDDTDFDSFYRMHEMTNARKGAPIYLPKARFENYFSRLHDLGLCRLFHARLPDGQSISTQMVLLGHPNTHTVTAALDPEFARMGATAFLRWKVFERLAALGFKANDLTDAELNPVTHFKSELGGDLMTSLVLSRPESLGFRLQRTSERGIEVARQAAKAILKPILGSKPGKERGDARSAKR